MAAWPTRFFAKVAVRITSPVDFCFTPPTLIRPQLILIKPNWGYPLPPPVTVRVAVVQEIVNACREAYSDISVVVLEGVCHKLPATEVFGRLGADRLQHADLVDAESLPAMAYANRHRRIARFDEVWAPALLNEADACISVGACKRTVLKGEPLFSASIKNLYGLLPRQQYRGRSPYARGQLHLPDVHQVIADVYGCLGHLFSAVVDASLKLENDDYQPDRGRVVAVAKVVEAASCLEADLAAAHLAGEVAPRYTRLIAEAQ